MICYEKAEICMGNFDLMDAFTQAIHHQDVSICYSILPSGTLHNDEQANYGVIMSNFVTKQFFLCVLDLPF